MGLSLFSVELLAKINICLSAFNAEPATHFSHQHEISELPAHIDGKARRDNGWPGVSVATFASS